ncbi:MAG: LysE family translocator [Desulfobacteraceae bacterium]|jgi:threonine/homoserine/homoserine lactone efflux protein
MISIETASAFFAASILLALAPGPDNIFVLTQSAIQGRSAGLMVMLGLCTGLVVHSSAVALGVAVIFQTSALAFTGLKLVGVGYLVYLAWQAFTAEAGTIQADDEQCKVTYTKLYARGIIMNITNPKVSIFFLAFLPQFADPQRGAISLQMLMLGGLFILATILIFGTIAMMAGTLGLYLKQSCKAQRVLNKMAGTVFLGLSLKLAITKQ